MTPPRHPSASDHPGSDPAEPPSSGPDRMHPADARLLHRLGAVVDVVDPVPDALVEAGKALFALRGEGAALMRRVDADALAGVRGETASRMHFFELDADPDADRAGESISLDVEVTPSGPFVDVLGAVDTGAAVPTGWTLVVETPSARYVAAVDVDGRFVVSRVPTGMLRFRLEREGAVPVTTPWVDAR